MSEVRLSVLGAGSVRCSVPVMAALATYFGERPLDITLYDADEERLDLFDRFARLCFLSTKSTHSLKSTTDYKAALEKPDMVIVQVGENCARKFLKETRRQGFAELGRASLIEQAVEDLIRDVHPPTPVLSLVADAIVYPRDVYQSTDWPPALTEAERSAYPLQVLRWCHGDEYVFEILRMHEKAPLKAWLDDPSSLPLVRA